MALATALVLGAGHASVPAAPRATAAGPVTMAALTQQFTEALEQQDLAKATACLARNVRSLANAEAVVSGRDSVSAVWLKRTLSIVPE